MWGRTATIEDGTMKRMPHSKLLAKKLNAIQNAWQDADRYPSTADEIAAIDRAIQAITPEIRKQFEDLQLSMLKLSKTLGEHIDIPEVQAALKDLSRAVDSFTTDEDGDRRR